MKKLLIIIFLLVLSSCSKLEFVYNDKENLLNPLYEKTKVEVSGIDLIYINSYIPMFFGLPLDNDFNLQINIEEKKTKRSVEKNQATSNISYELRFLYSLFSNKNNCEIYKKQILSKFSIIPKSSGYNYGSDASLEKKYELAIEQNLNKFISFLSLENLDRCL
mgnify:CR=1 FL=1